ncbi:hypothetical protein VNO77_21170 [Canavalia gladiata]|uniref:F-box domain-containing protein n=1 Tax=Canavalia gladiata TaxID=3824 RepID=A0AAN9LQT3_CANGL
MMCGTVIYGHEDANRGIFIYKETSKDDNLKKIRKGEFPSLLERTLARRKFVVIMGDIKEKTDKFFKNRSKKDKKGRKAILLNRETEITDLPSFIIQDILTRLPLRSIRCCKYVCKEWNKLIKEPSFPKLHQAHAAVFTILRALDPQFWPSDLHVIEATHTNDLVSPSKLYSKILPPQAPLIPTEPRRGIPNRPKFGIVNSCNGLLCVCTTPFNNPIYVCNPITGEYMMLPKPKEDDYTKDYIMGMGKKRELSKEDFVVSGFGFSPRTNQYKVMRILELQKYNEKIKHVQILTLGSNAWKTLGEIERWDVIGLDVYRRLTLLPIEAPYKQSSCVYLNGAVHWLGYNKSNPIFIGSFNFDDEGFVLIRPPVEFYSKEFAIENMSFGVLHDCLYLSDLASDPQFELWVRKDYADPSSWIKELVINTLSLNIWPRGSYKPIKYLDNGDLLMFHPSNALVCYNPKEQSFRCFKIRGIDSDFEMVPHVPSLLSMKDAVKVNGQHAKIRNVRSLKLLRTSRRLPSNWIERQQFLLVEENEDVVSA